MRAMLTVRLYELYSILYLCINYNEDTLLGKLMSKSKEMNICELVGENVWYGRKMQASIS